jgi:hypothetical protein
MSDEETLADVEATLTRMFPDAYEPPHTYRVTRWNQVGQHARHLLLLLLAFQTMHGWLVGWLGGWVGGALEARTHLTHGGPNLLIEPCLRTPVGTQAASPLLLLGVLIRGGH